MKKMTLALAIVLAGSVAGTGIGPSVTIGAPRASAATIQTASGAAIVQSALKYVGYRYSPNGTKPKTGFSPIGFVSYVYRQNGIRLPRDLQKSLDYAPQVPMAELRAGDLVFFKNTIWAGLSHVGIYVGDGTFVHAEYYGYGVTVTAFTNDARDGSYWSTHYLAANRPVSGV